MASKNISREKIISAFLFCAFDKNVGATSLQDIAEYLGIKKASLYNHFAGRDEMYAATLEYCRDYCERLSFIPENFMKQPEVVLWKVPMLIRQSIVQMQADSTLVNLTRREVIM